MGNLEVPRESEATRTKVSNEDAPENPSTEIVPKRSKAQGRKRTKTGCLTCRKRRIKCGEEKPTCVNCVKSKRQCEGYNQRVVFKDPLSLYRPSFAMASQSASAHSVRRYQEPNPQAIAGINQNIAPKLPWSLEHPTQGTSVTGAGPLLSPNNESGTSTFPHKSALEPDVIDHSSLPELLVDSHQSSLFDQSELGMAIKTEHVHNSRVSPKASPLWQKHTTAELTRHLNTDADRSAPSMARVSYDSSVRQRNDQNGTSAIILEPALTVHSQSDGIKFSSTGDTGHTSKILIIDKQSMNWDEDADDPFDISEDDASMSDIFWNEQGTQDDHIERNDLGAVIALQASTDNQSLSIRSFTSFIDRPNMLAEYVPTPQSTPLKDPMAARIFCHFVNVTGPSMSMFERHPANPSLIFRGTPVPRSQQHIWTYTFPALALHNPALLHAMMALSSLHISKLQDGPVTPSLKHYAIGLRRIAKSLSSDSRRRQPATLAAAMLLAFYECWSADHQKWSNHILGAKQLVCEIDFAGMTKQIRRKQNQQRQNWQSSYPANQLERFHGFDSHNDQIDENVISILMGKKVFYDQYGQVINDNPYESEGNEEYTAKDLETYETQRDLFWWYCKQDVYQSFLGGGRLFMDYSIWSHCPPRAPLGRLNATYGSFDHLVLLMGRLAAFAAKDLERKRSVIKANGGQWQPSELMRKQFSGSQDAKNQTHPRQVPQQTQLPPFSGMVPGVHEPKLPLGFEEARSNDSLPRSMQKEEVDLETQTCEAEIEWQEIRNAFDVLESRFGADFQPLGPEFSRPIQTPFGLALQYRTYGIAGIWMNFYMALIFCYRSHPSMPPAAMVAAGFSARETAVFANRLGQIAAGISPDCSSATEVNPGIGAALIESSTCLFVAGVQYQDAAQRFWTVDRLRNIARLTGWQTALAIATGCETSWVKAGELGRSPPYIRTTEGKKLPDIGISSRRIDRAFSGKSNEERRMVIEKPDRVHYALGVLGLEGDF